MTTDRDRGLGFGFLCDMPECENDRAFIDFTCDPDGILMGLLITCTECGGTQVESIRGYGGEGEGSGL
jgi:hypothetical protein